MSKHITETVGGLLLAVTASGIATPVIIWATTNAPTTQQQQCTPDPNYPGCQTGSIPNAPEETR